MYDTFINLTEDNYILNYEVSENKLKWTGQVKWGLESVSSV